MPTGGIKAETAGNYLACPNVLCVGGSWIAPGDLLAEGDYVEIEARARCRFSLISLERFLKDLVVTCCESLAQIGRVRLLICRICIES